MIEYGEGMIKILELFGGIGRMGRFYAGIRCKAIDRGKHRDHKADQAENGTFRMG